MNKNKKRRFAPGQKIPRPMGAQAISPRKNRTLCWRRRLPSCSQRHTVLILRIGNGLSSLIKSLFLQLEGDGEEVFSQMVDDLLCMASLVDSLYSILVSLADRRVCQKLAMNQGGELLREADAILERWQRYSLPEA